MIKILMVLVFLCFQGSTVFQAYDNTQFESQKLSLKKSKKLIFLDFYTDWCGPCKYMDSNVFTDAKLQSKLKSNFLAIKVNADSPESKALCSKYHINSYPTFVIIDSEGNSLLYLEGAIPANNLINELDDSMKLVKSQ